MAKIGRNDPCHCGSGKKYKKCCLTKTTSVSDLTWLKMRQTEGGLVPVLLKYVADRFREDALAEAWAEFFNKDDIELPDTDPPIEFETIFIPWFFYNWIDDGYFDASRTDLLDKPVAHLYLEEKAQKLDPFQQRFIKAVCAEHFSFFVVTDVIPGKSLDLKDLILNRTVSVYERKGSEMLRVGSILFARVVTMDNNSIMLGCAPNIIPASYQSYFIDLRESWELALRDLGADILFEYEDEIRDIYHEIIDLLNKSGPPQLSNNEGDPLELSKLYYQLDCLPEEAFSALQSLAANITETELLQDGQFDGDGKLQSIEIPWLEKIGTELMADQRTLKGTLIISGNKLTVDVNSRERGAAIKRKISRRLGKRAIYKTTAIQSVEKMMEDAQSAPDLASSQSQQEFQSQPEVQAMMKEMAAKHWAEWLDTPLPVLKNKSPRESVKTGKGRERLDALFLQFEGMSSENAPQPFDPDINAIKKELGYF